MARPLSLDLFILLFALSAALGVLHAYDPTLSYPLLSGIIASAGLYFIVSFIARAWWLIRGLVFLLILAGAGLALAFIPNFATWGEMPDLVEQIGAPVAALLPNLGALVGGFNPHPNAVASALVPLIPLAVALAVSRRFLFPLRFVAAAAALVMLFGLLLTYSRGGIIGLGVVTLAALAMALPGRAPLIFPIFVAAVGAVGVLIAGPETMSRMVLNTGRFDLFQNGVYLGFDYAFTGLGLGETFGMVYSRYSLLIQHLYLTYAHSIPLAVWLGQGVLGLVAYVGMIGSTALYAISVHGAGKLSRVLFQALWLGLVAMVIHGMFDARHVVEVTWVLPLPFVMLGLLVGAGRLAMNEAPDLPLNLTRPALAGVGVLIAAAAGLGLAFNATVQAAWYTNQGALAETRAAFAPDTSEAEHMVLLADAEMRYREALQLDPTWPPANRRLGNMLVERGEYEAALPYLETAYAGESAYLATIKGLGLAYLWTGQTERAADVLATMGDLSELIEELGVWAFYRGQRGETTLADYARETRELLVGRVQG